MSVSFSQVWDHIKKNGISLWDDVAGLIIRPPRAEYTINALGPKVFRIQSEGKPCPIAFERHDLKIENMRGLSIECSWYRPHEKKNNKQEQEGEQQKPKPCVVYLHGNSGSRLDAQECLYLLEHDITLFTYDATGSGISGGDWVTLGIYEKHDLAAVVEYLRGQTKLVSTIGLWGRSMGSVTSVMYAMRDPTINCLILDSPFSTLKNLITDLVEQHADWAPNFAVDGIVEKVRRKIMRKAAFDIHDLDTLAAASKCDVPCFIFHGRDDNFVRPAHSELVAEIYRGSCLRHEVEGGHNDERLSDARDVALSLIKLYLIDKPTIERERAEEAKIKKQHQEEQEKAKQVQEQLMKEDEERRKQLAKAVSEMNEEDLANNGDDDKKDDNDDDDQQQQQQQQQTQPQSVNTRTVDSASSPTLSDVLIVTPKPSTKDKERQKQGQEDIQKVLESVNMDAALHEAFV